jgi:DNA excision repair protein ERCC-2
LFPYDSVRPVQGELIEDVKEAIVSGKNLLVNAPTGLGKTASTLPAAIAYALENDKVVFFLTNRHTQHQIAIETLEEMKKKHKVEFTSIDLVGKQWMCSQDVSYMFSGDFNEFCRSFREEGKCEFYEKMKGKKGLSLEAKRLMEDLRFVAWNTEEMKKKCKDEKLCSYFMALEMAKQAQVIVADYYYMFNPAVRDNFLARIGRELEDCILIVDEGHNLPGRVRDLMTSKLSNFMLKNSIKEGKKFGFGEVVGHLSKIQDVLLRINLDDAEEVVVDKEKFVDGVNKIKKYEDLIAELEVAAEEIRAQQNKSSVGGVIGFLERWVGDDEGFVRYIIERETRQEP